VAANREALEPLICPVQDHSSRQHAVLTGPPLSWVDPVTTKAGIRPFTARQGFIYTFYGIDYDAVEAETMAARLDSIAGWTWRQIDLVLQIAVASPYGILDRLRANIAALRD